MVLVPGYITLQQSHSHRRLVARITRLEPPGPRLPPSPSNRPANDRRSRRRHSECHSSSLTRSNGSLAMSATPRDSPYHHPLHVRRRPLSSQRHPETTSIQSPTISIFPTPSSPSARSTRRPTRSTLRAPTMPQRTLCTPPCGAMPLSASTCSISPRRTIRGRLPRRRST